MGKLRDCLIVIISGVMFLQAMVGVGFANAELTDFPTSEPIGDIGINPSELGKDYVNVSYVANAAYAKDGTRYQLLSKEYDQDGFVKSFSSSNLQKIPEFHLQVSTVVYYEFCIVLTDGNNTIIGNSPIELLSPAEFIDHQDRLSVPPSLTNGISGPKIMAITGTGLEATLDIDAQSFPYINLLSEVVLDGVPFDGDPLNWPQLTKSNFSVKEDGRLQPIRDLVPPQLQGIGNKIADIVFVHDDSGSLGNEAAQVKANIQTFVNSLATYGIDYRIGLVPYGGGGGTASFSPPDGKILHSGVLHSTPSALISDINGMKFDGGTERAFCAMKLATQSIVWRPSTQKVVILVTDENNDSGGCNINETDVTSQLQQNNVTVYGLTAGHSEFNRIAAATGGKVFSVTSDFTSILAEIGSQIAAKYIVQYETDNKTLDGAERTVDLEITVDDGSGGQLQVTETQKYTPAPPITITLTPESEALSNRGQRDKSPLTITAKTTQGSASVFSGQATLFYANSGGSFSSISMGSKGNGLYSAIIPGNNVAPPYIQYYISATDGSSTSTLPRVDPTSRSFRISILPNSSPIIKHTPITSVQEGQSVNIWATVEDATNIVTKANMYYRSIGGNGLYNVLASAPNASSVFFSKTIPGSAVTSRGVEYYLYAEDDFGVSSTFGSADSPIQISVTSQSTASSSKNIGNITVYAANFTQDPVDTNLWTASGSVMVGSKTGGTKILAIGTSLKMHYDTNTIEGLSTGTIIALDIKRNPQKAPQNFPIYSGSFSIDCSANPAVLTMQGGSSKLRLIGNLPFLFPLAQNTITIASDSLVLHDVAAQITQGLNVLITLGDITLSQTGGSSAPITLKGGDLLKKYPINAGSNWTLEDLEIVMDFVKQSLTASGGLNIKGVVDGGFGVGATLGFIFDPFALETIGGKFNFPSSLERLATVPTTPPSAFGVSMNGASFLVDKISSGSSGLQFTAGGYAVLKDAAGILELSPYNPVSGNLALLIDLSGKVELSGAVSLFEHFNLASGKIGIGNPSYVAGHMDLGHVILGNVYFSVGAPSGYFEIIGKNSLTVQIPPEAPWIGGYVLNNQAVDATMRFNSSGIDMAEFRLKYKLYFVDLTIRLDVSNPSNPDLFVSGWDKTIQVFSVDKNDKTGPGITSLKNIVIDKVYDQVIVKVTSTTDAPQFNITFPNGTTYTPADATPTGTPENGGVLVMNDLFWIRNLAANESYYAINKPSLGTYALNITNDAAIGNYTVQILGPNANPSIALTSQLTNTTWDGASPIAINWTASDQDDNAAIELYYDSDNAGNDGKLIASGLHEEDITSSYLWSVDQQIQSGTYHIYAKIDDGENAPEYTYSVGTVAITNPNAPLSPQNVAVTPQDGSLLVAWDASAETNLQGYRLYVADDITSGVYTYDIGVGLVNSYEIQGLENAKDYLVSVAAVNTDSLESTLSAPLQVAPNGTGLGGSPDLTIDEANSSVTSASGKLDGTLTVTMRVQNLGVHDAYSARVSAYYGSMTTANLIDSQIIGQVNASGTVDGSGNPANFIDLVYTLDLTSFPNKLDGQNIFVRITDVNLPELQTNNNMGVIANNLPVDFLLNLDSGWNLISIPTSIQKNSCSPSTLLSAINGSYSSVWQYQNNLWKVFDPLAPGLSELSCIEAGTGLWINMDTATNLAISGDIPSKTIELTNGWNLVGVNSMASLPVEEALAAIDGRYVAVWAYVNGAWELYDPVTPGFSDLQTLQAGHGYWIATTQACTWTLP